MSTDDRLYCLPDESCAEKTPSDVLDVWLVDADPGTHQLEVEEWTVHPPRYHLAEVDRLLDWLADDAADGEVSEGYADAVDRAIRESIVFDAADLLLGTLAACMRWREAAHHVATLRGTVEVDINGRAAEPAWTRTEET